MANQIVNFDKNIVSVDELKDSVLDALIVSKALAKPEEASVKDTVREIMGVEDEIGTRNKRAYTQFRKNAFKSFVFR